MFCWIVSCTAEGGLAAKTLSWDNFVYRSLLSQQFRNEILLASEEMIYFKNTDCICRWQRTASESCRLGFFSYRHRGKASTLLPAAQWSRSCSEQTARSSSSRLWLNTCSEVPLGTEGPSLNVSSLLLHHFCCIGNGFYVFMFVYLYVEIALPRW